MNNIGPSVSFGSTLLVKNSKVVEKLGKKAALGILEAKAALAANGERETIRLTGKITHNDLVITKSEMTMKVRPKGKLLSQKWQLELFNYDSVEVVKQKVLDAYNTIRSHMAISKDIKDGEKALKNMVRETTKRW